MPDGDMPAVVRFGTPKCTEFVEVRGLDLKHTTDNLTPLSLVHKDTIQLFELDRVHLMDMVRHDNQGHNHVRKTPASFGKVVNIFRNPSSIPQNDMCEYMYGGHSLVVSHTLRRKTLIPHNRELLEEPDGLQHTF